jgi:hypothetical protein
VVFLAIAQTVVVYIPSRVGGLNHDPFTAGIVSLTTILLEVVGFVVANRVSARINRQPSLYDGRESSEPEQS